MRSALQHLLNYDADWYMFLAGEPSGLKPPTDPDYYARLGHLETDYQVILARYEQLACILTDLELATYFANSTVYVPWLGARLPNWQGVLSAANQVAHFRERLFGLMHQLGHRTAQAALDDYYARATPFYSGSS